jgi:hypothetical protein
VTTSPQPFSVYVIELKTAASPVLQPMGSLYVGETGLSPTERYQRHLSGIRSSKIVHDYGVCLRPDLSIGVGPFESRAEARIAEARLANSLRAAGYDVHGGQGRPFMENS